MRQNRPAKNFIKAPILIVNILRRSYLDNIHQDFDKEAITDGVKRLDERKKLNSDKS